ncbi:MAG TPA: TfuA-related McrA-glycine thioamidation protein [Methanocorpusculum sp.]|nr:TfuA-related McrA-glycine thioamidation protein [Methanocorpusculum sp.]HJJ53473.1 TfuA-related McrA-glycine thioamidation protein [Methanocorpusculum sp.]
MWILNVVVFIGPSLDVATARSILPDAVYLPPVKRGDASAAADGADIMVIIDGVFFQNQAVGHRELLGVMKKGVTVFGSSSMGALRASELDTLGMTGIGKIYHQYRSGEIIADDEVGLVYDTETGVALSEPMVNMRASFSKAFLDEIITKEEETSLLKACKAIYYPDRTYRRVIKEAPIPDERKASFLSWLKTNAVDQKRLDAIECLTTVRDLK